MNDKLMLRAFQEEDLEFLDRLDTASRKDAMKQIRAAEWYDDGAPPVVKVSPHGGRALGLFRV